MTIDRRNHDLTDDRLKAAAALAFGATIDEAATFCGKSSATVSRIKQEPCVQNAVEIIAAYKSIHASKSLKDAINDAVENAEDRIKRIFNRATRLTERAVERVEALGDDATLAELMSMHKEITVWASKYAASEAPKRFQVDGTMTHEYKAVISLEAAESALRTRQQLQSAVGVKALIDVTPSN